MKRLSIVLLACMFGLGIARAEDAYAWLQKMNQAARSLSFTGVYVYQTQGRTESSRIVRLIDASGEHERVQALDGTPREVLRHNEDVQCFLPADKLLVLDKVALSRQPGRLLSRPDAVGDLYEVQVGSLGRVAGRSAQILQLTPRDEMRYGQKLWIDVATGLLLKARIMNGHAGMLEQFAFTELHPDAEIGHDKFIPDTGLADGWRVIDAAGEGVLPDSLAWVFTKRPQGFKQVSLLRRTLRKGESAIHAAFSDGFANISIFIEPLHATPVLNAGTPVGAKGVYRRVLGDYQLIAMGEVPLAALQFVADGVEPRK